MTDIDKALRESHFHIQWCQLSEYILQVPLKTWLDQRANSKEKPNSTWSLFKPEFPDIVQPKIVDVISRFWSYCVICTSIVRFLHAYYCQHVVQRECIYCTHVALFNSPLPNSSNWKRTFHLFASLCFFFLFLCVNKDTSQQEPNSPSLFIYLCVIIGLCINTE